MKLFLVSLLVLTVVCRGLVLCAQENGKTTDKFGKVVPGSYNIDKNGEYYQETNIAGLWTGVWEDGSNGLRVQLSCWDTNTQNPSVSVDVGSITKNSGPVFRCPPDRKFKKFELRDSRGMVVSPLKGMSMEKQYDFKLPKAMFRTKLGSPSNIIAFFTNSPPAVLNSFHLNSIYKIGVEDDYTLTVCAVMYEFGTNTDFLNRIDLPCISTKIHLVPQPPQ